jgi:hypothetical protein
VRARGERLVTGPFVSKEDPERGGRDALSKTIADLTRAIEELASDRKKSQELEGIITEAKVLARQWKIKESSGQKRPLFGDIEKNITFLLAGLVIALRRDHDLLEHLRRYVPEDLETLTFRSWYAWIMRSQASAQQKRLLTEKYEYKRRMSRFKNLIEFEFGGGLLLWSTSLPNPTLVVHPTCLDDIFAGGTVSMLRLQALFGMERKRLTEALQDVHKEPYNCVAVVKIMDFLLNEKPRESPERAKRGRPRRLPWLNDHGLRNFVLTRIAERISILSVAEPIRSAFLTVIRRHLSSFG